MRQEAREELLRQCVSLLKAYVTANGTRDLRETRLTQLEEDLDEASGLLLREVLAAVLRQQAEQAATDHACPQFGEALEEKPPCRNAAADAAGTHALAPTAAAMSSLSRRFFPQAKALGCEVDATCSPALQRKILAAVAATDSYEEASSLLAEVAEVEVGAEQCRRVAQSIGQARVAERKKRRKAL